MKVSKGGSWLKCKHTLLLSSLTSVGLMPPVKFGRSNKESTTGSLEPIVFYSPFLFQAAGLCNTGRNTHYLSEVVATFAQERSIF